MTTNFIAETHFFSQFIYLNLPPRLREAGTATVGEITRYYIQDPVGSLLLKTRFKKIPREYAFWKEFLAETAPAFGHWRVVDVLDDNDTRQSGFYGCSFTDGDTRIVAFRGSELLGNPDYRNDYVSDFALAYTTQTPQQKVVEQYWRRFGGGIRERLLATGHSLGGNLALYGAVCLPPGLRDRLVACHAYNGPGFSGEFIAEKAKEIGLVRERLFLFQNQRDPVSSMLLNLTEPVILACRELPDDGEETGAMTLFYPHSNFLFEADGEGGFALAPEQEKSRFCRMVHSLTLKVLDLPVPARRELAEALLAAIYDLPEGKSAPEHILSRLTAMASHSGSFLAGAGFELAKLLFSGAALAKRGETLALPEDGEEENALCCALPPLMLLFGNAIQE